MFGGRDRRRSDSDLYVKLSDSKNKVTKKSKIGGSVVDRSNEITHIQQVTSPRRKSIPFDLDAEHFIRNARPVRYTYPDSPANSRARRSAGIEKDDGMILGIPGAFQHLGKDGETLIAENNINVCLLSCVKHLLGRVEDLEHVVREMRNEKAMAQSNWSVQSIGKAAADTLLRRGQN